MVEASREQQVRLLELQQVDTRIAQLRAAQRKHPALATLEELQGRHADLERAQAGARSHVGDCKREASGVEADLERLVARQDKMSARLAAGEGSPKDLQAIQYELDQMAQRREVLETEVLTLMDALESAESKVAAIGEQLEALAASKDEAQAELDAALGEVGAELAEQVSKRESLAAQLDGALLDEYEHCRSRTGGLGVLEARGRQIVGMMTDLSEEEWHGILTMGEDEVYVSEELDCLVVRSAAN
ncbi:MAG: hypothetical protein Q4P06_06635 [Actinomycetaceae bacterium]|nr:hypothetical protein [Actinomycetaceae bacterium]